MIKHKNDDFGDETLIKFNRSSFLLLKPDAYEALMYEAQFPLGFSQKGKDT